MVCRYAFGAHLLLGSMIQHWQRSYLRARVKHCILCSDVISWAHTEDGRPTASIPCNVYRGDLATCALRHLRCVRLRMCDLFDRRLLARQAVCSVCTPHLICSFPNIRARTRAVVLVSNTYLANLAAFLSIDRLTVPASAFRDLWGKVVGTYPVWEGVLEATWGLTTKGIPAVGNGARPPLPAAAPAGVRRSASACLCLGPGCSTCCTHVHSHCALPVTSSLPLSTRVLLKAFVTRKLAGVQTGRRVSSQT
jgi:hypothetical protein